MSMSAGILIIVLTYNKIIFYKNSNCCEADKNPLIAYDR